MFKTVQEAVNAARPGQVIEIMDVAVYEEQVTIDGRDVSPWNGKNQFKPGQGTAAVVGGKNGITIKYTPPGGGRLFGNHARPTIKWKDVINHSPKTTAEGTVDGDTVGSSGNFETCGALRIIRAQGVTIDGIKVDGDGLAPFGTDGVWGTVMFHGNAAIAVVVSGGTVIRNCDIGNAYYGIAIKDRNIGGVNGNPNPGDLQVGTAREVLPLSKFGTAGNHLFEYNKIHGNMTGIFTESAWDLGSTIRYNLIYENRHKANILGDTPGKSNACGGAILFRDVLYTPFAIYNNTFYRNSRNLMGTWKAGAAHLVFNNIFSKPDTLKNGFENSQTIEDNFPYRMYNSVFAANNELKYERANVQDCKRAQVQAPGGGVAIEGVYGQQIFGFTQVQIQPMPQPRTGITQVRCLEPIADSVVGTNAFVPHGAPLTGQGGAFPESANLRWLETARWSSISGTEDLFVSTDTSSADFLRPKWDHARVTQFIKNKGWALAGMRNSDGTIADLGAISSTGRALPTVARVKPTNVVLVSGTSATANYFVNVEGGTMTNATVNFLRWVAPLPTTEDKAVPANAITSPTKPTGPVAVNGNNRAQITVPALPTTNDTLYGFFEIAVAGKDANGNDVTSDIGFLPYRKLDYTLKLEVRSNGVKVDTVRAGEQYTLNVKPCRGTNTQTCASYTDGDLSNVSFELQSDASAFMYTPPASNWPNNPFDYTPSVSRNGQDFPVYFTKAGGETIMSTGVSVLSGDRRLVFIGTVDIYVKPGAPDHLIFTDPIPLSQLGNANATVINRGVERPVTVEVQDKWNNPVDVPVQVSISSNNTEVGDVGAPGNINTKSVTTTGKTGVAEFIAKVTNGTSGQTFDMTATASITGGNQRPNDNVGRLRVGRALDRLEVFYSDNGPGKQWQTYFDPTVVIDTTAGAWVQITVKVVVGDSVNTGRPNQFVLVSPSDNNLVFSATAGGTPSTVFPLNAGVATFWVGTAPGANRDISNAGINVYALRTNSADDIDASIASGGRENINFRVPVTAIEYAVVYGDGQGRPDSLLIHYFEGGTPLSSPGAMPSRVTLNWSGAVLSAEGGALSGNGLILRAVFTGASRPTGKTSISGVGSGLVKVYGGSGGANAVEEVPSLYDGVGPVLANGIAEDGADGGAPLIYENADNSPVDTIVITISEDIRDESSLTKLRYTVTPNPIEPSGPTDGVLLSVISAAPIGGRSYKLAVTHTDDGPIPEGWIRLDPGAGSVTDRAATQSAGIVAADNKPHDRNRWVKLSLQGRPPTVKTAWYTANNATGKPDYAYVEFNKSVDNLGRWFTGGSVNFDGARAVSDVGAFFSVVDGGTLRIDLSAATAFASPSSTTVRTSGDMSFTLTFGSGVADWGSVSVVAADRAKPVLALGAELRTGSPKGAGEGFNQDTLVVYYSEQINTASLASNNPITLMAKAGKYQPFQPELQMLSSVVSGNGYYVTRYLVVNEIPQAEYPESGDSVHICHLTGIGDAVDSSNVQDDEYNRWAPLTVKRAANWKIAIGANPFVSDASGSNSMGFLFDPRPRGVTKMTVKANIRIFDNVGALVIDTTVDNGDGSGDKMVSWRWRGENKKGRLVGTGTYLLKATCESKAEGDSKPDVYKVPMQMLGVVRGKQ
jgi:hypothetical protein